MSTLELDQVGMQWVSVNLKRGQDLRVFVFLLGILNFADWVPVSQASIAKFLELPRQNVNRSFARLKALGILEHDSPEDGHTGRYRIAPHIAWRGTASDRQETLKVGWIRRDLRPVP